MSKEDDYRRKATECMAAAEVTTVANVLRATYLDLAKYRGELARQAETLDRPRKF